MKKYYTLFTFWVVACFGLSKPTVTVTLAPYAYAVEKIADNQCDVHILVPENANPHIYEAKPQDVKKLAQSTLWFCSGEQLEKKLLSTIKAEQIDLNQDIHLSGESKCAHHHHQDYDLHTWVSPKNYLIQSKTILTALCEAFPEHKVEFENNFAALEDELSILIEKIEKLKSSTADSSLIVSHAAYHYLCDDLNIKQISIEHEGKEASLKHIQKIFKDSQTTPPKQIFAEVQHSDAGAKRLAELLKVEVVAVNPYQKEYPYIIEEITGRLK